jgi:hypothetical protein
MLPSLAGEWCLFRRIDNGLSMNGLAKFGTRTDGRFAYHEKGELCLPDGYRIDAERRYLFEACEGGFRVLFDETPPRLFHRIHLEATRKGWVGRAVYVCMPDRYDSRYQFDGDGSFAIRHAVDGPHKRYVIETSYRRADPLG